MSNWNRNRDPGLCSNGASHDSNIFQTPLVNKRTVVRWACLLSTMFSSEPLAYDGRGEHCLEIIRMPFSGSCVLWMAPTHRFSTQLGALAPRSFLASPPSFSPRSSFYSACKSLVTPQCPIYSSLLTVLFLIALHLGTPYIISPFFRFLCRTLLASGFLLRSSSSFRPDSYIHLAHSSCNSLPPFNALPTRKYPFPPLASLHINNAVPTHKDRSLCIYMYQYCFGYPS